MRFEAGRTHSISLGTAHQPVCQHALADGEQRGEMPYWEVTAGVGQVTRCFWERKMCIINSSGLANLLYFLQPPKGGALKHNRFNKLCYFIIIIF